MLTGSDDDLIARVRELPEDQISGTHYNLEDMRRRIKAYRLANNSVVAEPSVQDFFKQQGIKFFSESIQTRCADALNAFKIYIERVSIFPLHAVTLPNHSLVSQEREAIQLHDLGR